MSGFKIAVPAGVSGEKAAKFIADYNVQSDKLADFEGELLKQLAPHRAGREYAWRGMVMAAMHFTGRGVAAERGSQRLYDRIAAFSKYLQKEGDRRALGEFSDYRVNQLLLLSSDIAASRPRPRHKATQSPVPVDLIYELAFHYRRCTGRKTGAGKGPFARFVWDFWQKVGCEREYNTVIADLKKAHKARPAAFNGNNDEA